MKPLLQKLSLVGISVLLSTAVLETGLRLFAPMPLLSVGSQNTEAAKRYGWGYDPLQLITLRDPDSGAIIWSRMNDRGWRDKNRSVENKSRAFRILVLGDSNTFGVIVPDQALYTNLLERKLRDDGINAEVINMSLGGWGTDQELEAFLSEGRLYRPDVVVLQFCTNDLADNLQLEEDPTLSKPFAYSFDEAGKLVRTEKALVAAKKTGLKDRLKKLIPYSELLKRAYFAKRFLLKTEEEAAHENELRVDSVKLTKLAILFHIDKKSGLYVFYQSHLNQPLDADELRLAILNSAQAQDVDDIMRLSEEHRFLQRGLGGGAPVTDPSSAGWRLTLGLIRRLKEKAEEINAPLLLETDNEEGAYEWEVYWYRLPKGDEAKKSYLKPSEVLRDFAARKGIQFVEPLQKHQRARNDPHPNEAGNLAMAENLYRHLKSHFTAELEAHKISPERIEGR